MLKTNLCSGGGGMGRGIAEIQKSQELGMNCYGVLK